VKKKASEEAFAEGIERNRPDFKSRSFLLIRVFTSEAKEKFRKAWSGQEKKGSRALKEEKGDATRAWPTSV